MLIGQLCQCVSRTTFEKAQLLYEFYLDSCYYKIASRKAFPVKVSIKIRFLFFHFLTETTFYPLFRNFPWRRSDHVWILYGSVPRHWCFLVYMFRVTHCFFSLIQNFSYYFIYLINCLLWHSEEKIEIYKHNYIFSGNRRMKSSSLACQVSSSQHSLDVRIAQTPLVLFNLLWFWCMIISAEMLI